MSRKSVAVAQALIWLVLLASFVATNAPIVRRNLSWGYLLPANAASSTDAYLSLIEKNRALTEPLAAWFGTIPADRSVVIFHRDDQESTLLAMLMVYLCWPHRVQVVPVSPGTARRQLASVDFGSAGAVVTCRVPLPPHVPEGIALAPDVHVVWFAGTK